MRYIKVENDNPTDYSIDQLLIDYPDAVIYKKSSLPQEELLKPYNVYPLITTPQPAHADDEVVEESVPKFIHGEWTQTWNIRKMIQEEIEEVIKNNPFVYVETEIYSSNPILATGKEIAESRYEICQTCPSFTILKTCKECGCIMPLKVRLRSSECPLGKW